MDSTSGEAAMYQLILDHILVTNQQNASDLPLRTTYTINCSRSPLSRRADPMEQFTSNMMAQIASLPQQPTSFPPSFVTSFVRKCFTSDCTTTDWSQALNALDYLKDLEQRRRREVATALQRLSLDRDNITRSNHSPATDSWLKSLEAKERKVNTLYTELSVSLRRWTLINEMLLAPLNKHNCLAMLNTLYPPTFSSDTHESSMALQKEREPLFKLINRVEQNGKTELNSIICHGRNPGDTTGWPAVHICLEDYLQLANSIISECMDIVDVDDISKRVRKADSGISFSTLERRPSSSGSDATNTSEQSVQGRRKRSVSVKKQGSTLERLARDLMSMGRRKSAEDEEQSTSVESTPVAPSGFDTDKPKALRKIRSFGNIGNMRLSMSGSSSYAQLPSHWETPAFDVAEMKEERQRFEARMASK